jgi:hypothetical protein
VLSHDLVNMILLTQAKAGWSSLPSLVLLGHSLGGAVVTETANKGLLGAKLLGYAVLDVVEGSAMEVLNHMHTYLASRPKSFASLEAAIEWHVRTRTLRNPQAAKASVPSLLLQGPDGRWAWRTDLASTEPYWENWFTGLSGKFLSGRGAKLLLLAGTDRLDKELMIGQMQGALFDIHRDGTAYMIANTVQANFNSTSSPPQGTSCTKTSPKRQPRSSSSLSNATTGARSCFPQRCRTSLHRARKSESLRTRKRFPPLQYSARRVYVHLWAHCSSRMCCSFFWVRQTNGFCSLGQILVAGSWTSCAEPATDGRHEATVSP